jgi:hypothetical protein
MHSPPCFIFMYSRGYLLSMPFISHVHSSCCTVYFEPRLHAFPMFGIAHGDAMLFQARSAPHAGVPTDATNGASSSSTPFSRSASISYIPSGGRLILASCCGWLDCKSETPFGRTVVSPRYPSFAKGSLHLEAARFLQCRNYILTRPKVEVPQPPVSGCLSV